MGLLAAAIRWKDLTGFDTPLLEIVIRGTVMYLALFGLLRFVLRREAGAMGVTDLLVVVLIADAAQNAMADDYKSLPDGILLVAVIVAWAFALNWLSFRSRFVERIVRPPKVPLIRNGHMIRPNLRRELVTTEELWGQLRLQGIDDISEVEAAYMESDGRISVLKSEKSERDGEEHEPARDRPLG